MRIALVTEQFAPSTDPAAHVTREVLSRLIDARSRRHRLRRRQGARHVRWCPAVLGEPDDSGLRRPGGDGALPARRLPPHRPAPAGPQGRRGGRPARRTDRRAGPPPLEARRRPRGPPPRPARPGPARPLGPGELPRRQPARGGLHRRPRPHEGAQPPRRDGAAARRAAGGPRRRPRRGDAADRRRQGAAARHRARASPLPGLLRRAAAAAQEGGLRPDRARGPGQRRAGDRVRRRDGRGRRDATSTTVCSSTPDVASRPSPARWPGSRTTASCWPRWPSCPGAPSPTGPGTTQWTSCWSSTIPTRWADPLPRSAEPDGLRPRCGRRCPCCASRSCCRATPAGRTCGRPRAPSSG